MVTSPFQLDLANATYCLPNRSHGSKQGKRGSQAGWLYVDQVGVGGGEGIQSLVRSLSHRREGGEKMAATRLPLDGSSVRVEEKGNAPISTVAPSSPSGLCENTISSSLDAWSPDRTERPCPGPGPGSFANRLGGSTLWPGVRSLRARAARALLPDSRG